MVSFISALDYNDRGFKQESHVISKLENAYESWLTSQTNEKITESIIGSYKSDTRTLVCQSLLDGKMPILIYIYI